MKRGQVIDLLRVFTAQGHDALAGIWETYRDFYPDKQAIKGDQGHVTGWRTWYNDDGEAAGFNSRLAKEHPDWLIRDPHTKTPVVAGPNWEGDFMRWTCMFEARAYLKEVVDTVLHDGGFDMLQLGFCFAAAMIPRQGKSRGQTMWEAVDLIRGLIS
ncbi:hypothetical protein G6F43_004585 [Rhizopus delemar]|nr:hypothetical protein G6F43_004585 [Rhizopus delemar]